jgi:dTDP-4-dehydrorhamnose reductase
MATVVSLLEEWRPHAVVNCVGVIKQLPEGDDPVVCIHINALFPHLLARACRERGIRLIHISTDCVFSGHRGNYREDDPSDAVDLYGRTKYLGEVSEPGCITVRTSMIGRELSSSHGLLEWFLAQRGRSVRGYRKAVFSGLTTLELASVITRILTEWTFLSGVCQVVAEPIDKYSLLCLIRDIFGLEVEIQPDTSHVCDRSLDGSRFHGATNYVAPSWRAMIEAMRADPTPYEALRGG